MAYNGAMEFIETSYFSKQVYQLLTDDEYAMFQGYMVANPKAGEVIQGTGGLRKVRWAAGSAVACGSSISTSLLNPKSGCC